MDRRDARGPGRGPSRTEHGGREVPRGADGVELVPGPRGGLLRPGGLPGNRGGGRPPNELRERIRELGAMAVEQAIALLESAKRTVPPRRELERMRKAELIDMLDRIGSWLEINPTQLKQILDVAYKYGVGTKHVHVGDDGDGPIRHGVVVLPAIEQPETE